MFGIPRSEFKIFLGQSLNKKETELLRSSNRLRGNTFYYVVKRLSEKGYSPSTIKFVLKRLKYLNLVDFGDGKSRGKPLVLTALGQIFLEVISGEKYG